ncbi:MAG: leucine-rich repeat protein [Rikenellaceae bacterium]
MKKLFVFALALLAVVACNDTSEVEEVVITTLEGSSFSLSEFGAHTFPATDSWVITDDSATTDDFEGLSAAIEYISASDSERSIALEFTALTAIPSYAIYGTALSDASRSFTALGALEAPYAVSVGAYAFDSCSSLSSIYMPLAESVDKYAFNGCTSLQSLEMEYATSIGASAFNNCNSMQTIDLPLVESLGEQAFRLCSSVEELSFPELIKMGAGALSYCTALTSLDAPQLISLGDYALCEAVLLTTISTPLLEEIGSYAFIACASLESYTITESVATIGNGIFNSCDNITQITMEDNDLYLFEDGMLYDAAQSELILALQSVISGDIVFPTTLVTIRDRALYNCYQVTSIEVPAVEIIPYGAFAFCEALITATFDIATTFEAQALFDCQILETLSAPYLTTLESKSLYNCDSITDLSIATAPGVALDYIDVQAFYGAYIDYTILTLSAANADYVSYGDTLTVGEFTAEFYDIDVLEE